MQQKRFDAYKTLSTMPSMGCFVTAVNKHALGVSESNSFKTKRSKRPHLAFSEVNKGPFDNCKSTRLAMSPVWR